MPKPKKLIEQPINLSPDVFVVVKAPRQNWPHISWNGGTLVISVEDEAPSRPAIAYLGQQPAQEPPQSNGPMTDTPEILAAKARLPRAFTTADAFRGAGIDISDEELTPEALEAAAGGMSIV